jgi:intracellular septation protein
MQAFIEYFPLVIFFIVYKAVDIYWAAGALVGAMAFTLLLSLALKKPIKKTTLYIFAFATVMAALTVIFQEKEFLKWKFTVLYVGFGSVLLISRYVMKVNLIKKSMASQFTLPEAVWDKVNIAWTAFFYGCSMLNVYIFNNWSLDSWVNFKVFGVTGMMVLYVVLTVFYIYPHLPDEDKE